MELLLQLARAILFILPSYFANATPVILGGGPSIDGGRKFLDGQRVFGDGKTVRGFFSGIFAGIVASALECIILSGTEWDIYAGDLGIYVAAGLLLGLGTMGGDLLGSFIKRRQGVARGKPSVIMDQLMFLAVALVVSYPIAAHLLVPESVAFLFVLTYFVHSGANIIANRLGLKNVPW
jgi:CDP-2,3-bis-(O-geranylgeranyl)-sn-glycerol synthase